MQFRNGKAAIQYYAEYMNDPVRGRTVTAFVCEDEGAHLGYDSNGMTSLPQWSDVVDTIHDLTKIFAKALTTAQLNFAIKWAQSDLLSLEPEGDYVLQADEISARAICDRITFISKRLEKELIKNDYLTH